MSILNLLAVKKAFVYSASKQRSKILFLHRLANQPLSASKFQTMADREIQRASQKVIQSKRPIGQETEGAGMPSKTGFLPHYGA